MEINKKQAHEFRPRRLSRFHDWAALGGSIGGLFCLTLGFIRFRNEKIEPTYRIGDAPGVDLPTALSPTDAFALVAPSGNNFVFNFADHWDGDFTIDGTSTPLSVLKSEGRARASTTEVGALEILIPPRGSFRVLQGDQTIVVSSVTQPKKHPVPFLANIDTSFFTYSGGTALCVFGFIAFIVSIPPSASVFAFESLQDGPRLVDAKIKPNEDPLQKKEPTQNGENSPSGGREKKMALAAGKMGTEKAIQSKGRFQIKKAQLEPQISRHQAMEDARIAGILGVYKSNRGDVFASLTSLSDFTSGHDNHNIKGGFTGYLPGESKGGIGFSVHDLGPGGGGDDGWNTIGNGKYNLIGPGSGPDAGYDTGTGHGDRQRRKPSQPTVGLIKAKVDGNLDKSIIRRHIRRQLPRIRHCYERELVVNPQLSGTVTTQFQISPKGHVQGAHAKGLGSTKVESCVTGVIKSIQFPQPDGGGTVNVRYPFTFQPAEG